MTADRVPGQVPGQIKVLHVTGVRIGGGVPRYVTQILAEAKLREATHGLACAPSSRLHQWLSDDPDAPELFELGDSMTRDAAASIVRIRRLVQDWKPDIVHLHSSEAGVLGRLALPFSPVPVVFQPHAWSFLALTGSKRRAATVLERGLARMSRAHVLCGSDDEAAIGRDHGITSHSVISNSVDLDRVTPIASDERLSLARSITGLDPDPLVIMVGRLSRQKAPEVLLSAWQRAKDRLGPRPVLALIGDGPDRPALERVADDSVLFVGEVDDVRPWHRAADVSVLASRYETLSLSMLESLACGTPVVATRTGGVTKVLGGDHAPGAVVEIDDAEALAAALVRIGQVAPALRESARARVEGYGRKAWAESLFGLYGDLIGQRTGQ